MENSNQTKEQDFLFTIDNTRYYVNSSIAVIFYYIYLMALLTVLMKNDNMSYLDFLSNTAHTYNRFASLLILFVIMIPIVLISIYRLNKKLDNTIYFKNDEVIFQNTVIKINQIKAIKMGCCVVNGGFLAYLYVYTIGFIFILPWMLLEISAFFITKFKYKIFDGFMPCRFIINGGQSIQGYCYDNETKMKLMNFKNQIENGEK